MFSEKLNTARQAIGRLTDLLLGRTDATSRTGGMRNPSRKDMQLTLDEYAVKCKLGSAWFTKKRTDRQRRKMRASLTNDEYAIAMSKGWLK